MLTSKNCMFTYQPVLDRKSQPVALAVLYQQEECAIAEDDEDTIATARIVMNAYLNSEVIGLLGERKIFVKVDTQFLESGMIAMLPAQKAILELVQGEYTNNTRDVCKGLKRMGYTFALEDFAPTPSMMALLDVAEIIKIDISAMPRMALVDAIASLREMPVTLLAVNVESQQDFDDCRELGFDLFQGHYFARPRVLVARCPDLRRINILSILSGIEQDVGDKEIEEVLKLSPDLMLHLLRLINSAAFGLQTRVGSMREVLSIFGRSKLEKWLQILLFNSSEHDAGGWALFALAAKRGRMIESLVQDVTHQPHASQQDRGFMVGMLSLLDVLLGTPMEEVLSKIGVAEEIHEALLTRSGTLGRLLQICEALEEADFDAVAEMAAGCKIPLARVMEAQREATLWATTVADEIATAAD